MCFLIFWSSYIHNWVEICLQFGWNIFTTGLKYFWKSYRSQWAFIFWSRVIQKGIQNEYSQFFWNISWKFKYDLNWVEIFLKILSITIRHFLKWQYSQYVSSFFFTMFLDLFLFLNIKIDDCQYLRSQFLKN